MVVRRLQIIAHHLILPLYGHWAPNDLRGSGSTEFYNDKFEPLGPIHFGRRPPHEQPTREQLREFHRRFKALLKHPVFWIDEAKRTVIAAAIADVIAQNGYTVYACAICANHVHLVVRIHRDDAVTMWNKFAAGTGARLRACDRFADIAANHPVWADRPYKVFLYTPADVRGRVNYVEQNPIKEGLPQQRWNFIVAYDNWPHHKQRAR